MNTEDHEACLSDLMLDEWLADELDPDIRAQTATHLESCARCRDRLATIEAETAAFLSQAPTLSDHRALAEATAAAQAAAQRGRTLAIASSVLALAAMVSLAVFTQRADEQTRLKASPHVDYFIKRGEQVFAGAREQAVRVGDELRFVVSTPRAAHLALFHVDAKGAGVSFPTRGETSAAIAASAKQPLDVGIALDDALGTERVYAVFCPTPFAIKEALKRVNAPNPAPPRDCTLDTITLHKALP